MNHKPQTVIDFLRRLSPKDFKVMGLNEMAYIKQIKVDGHDAFAVHAADGTPLTVNDTKETALGSLFHNELNAVSIH